MNQKIQTGLLVSLLLVLMSCGGAKPPAPAEEKTHTITVTETVHDTVFKIEKDSSSYKALLECQNGKAVLKNVIQAGPGRSLKSPKVRIENNKLSVDCETRAQELLAQWKSRQVKEVELKTIRITKYINRLTFWQELQIWLGRIFLVIIVCYVIRIVYKVYIPI